MPKKLVCVKKPVTGANAPLVVVYVKKRLGPSMCVIECPRCHSILAAAAEMSWLPTWSFCTMC